MPPPTRTPADPPPPLPRWHFAVAGSPQRQRNSLLDEHFAGSGSNRTGDLVREGGQNSGDAASGSGGPVRVRIGFGELDAQRAAVYAAGLAEHAASADRQASPGSVTVVPADGPCRFLTFEDFNTTGLTGQTEVERRYKTDPPNAFHTFFRAEGQTDKTDGTKQGSKGVGKVTFLAVGRPRAVLGLTYRPDDDRTLLFGTAVLQTHRHDDKDYDGDGWFGRVAPDGKRIDPVEHEGTIERFRDDFDLTRGANEPGFSIVVPWIDDDPEDGVTPDKVIDAVLRDHALPILHGKLTFEVVADDGTETVIDAAHFLAVLDARPDERLIAQVRPVAELASWARGHPPTADADRLGLHKETAPAWSDPDLLAPEQRDRLRATLDAGDPIAVRVPVRVRRQARGTPEQISHFDVFLRKEPVGTAAPAVVKGGTVQFVRGGLLISGMGRQLAGYRGLVVADDAPLAGFLRAAENPSHTKWSAKPKEVKDAYKYAPGTLAFVLDAPRELTKLLAGDPAERDATVWADVLGIPEGDLKLAGGDGDGSDKHKKGRAKGAGGVERGGTVTTTKIIVPPVKKRPFDVIAAPGTGGFVVRPSGRPFPGPMPARVELRLAYYIRGRDPLDRWSKADFDLTRASAFPSTSRACDVETREPNRLVIRIDDPDFEFTTDGFDVRREPFCKARLLKPPASDSTDDDGDGPDGGDGEAADDGEADAAGATEGGAA